LRKVPQPPLAMSAVAVESGGGQKVTVLGGTGFVGSRVVQRLVDAGATVTSVSQSGKAPSWCAGEAWTEAVHWVAQDLTRGSRESVEAAVGTPDALVSCVGSIGFDVQGSLLGNGIANVAAAKAAGKAGSCSTYVYCSVASEVAACEKKWLPPYFSGYFKGKRMAEAAFKDAAECKESGGRVVLVKPSFIYGGDSFGLFPPRVNDAYGSVVEELLSVSLTSSIADALPGLIKVALRPPVSVESLAAAMCAATLAGSSAGSTGTMEVSELDGTAAINSAAGQPAATGMTDFVASISKKIDEMKGSE